MIQQAEAYKAEVVARAEGDANRFLAVYNEFVQAKEVTTRRLYLETMEDVLQGMTKIVIDGFKIIQVNKKKDKVYVISFRSKKFSFKNSFHYPPV